MKKISLLLLFSILFINIFSQSKEKTIFINNNTILNGGQYLLLTGKLGEVILLEDIIIKYNYKDSSYTSSATDTIKIKSGNHDGSNLIDIAYILDDLVTSNDYDFISYSLGFNTSSIYGNNIYLYIPSGQFTLGNSELYIKLKYRLEK